MTIASQQEHIDAADEREEMIKLSAHDWSWMLDLFENPKQANNKMTAAIEKYQTLKHDDSNTFLWM